jgi:hypothetical protein
MTIDPAKTHYGAKNASAAVFLNGTRFLVADDEDQQRTILRLYEATADGPPVEEFHLSNGILQPDSDEPEIDIEGSAWHNGCIYWIGSHSRSKKGKPRPSRHRLFATAIHDGVPVITGSPYRNLISDLEEVLGKKLDRSLPPKKGGISIEGLSATPGNELLIAFRSPLIDDRALVVMLKNPDELMQGGEKASFGEPILLDLDGRGIRSLEYWHRRSSYLIIAGPEGGGDEDFALMRWSGPLSTHPETLSGVSFDRFQDENSAPEGLLIELQSGTVYILFDEGNRQATGRSFRSMAIHDLLP